MERVEGTKRIEVSSASDELTRVRLTIGEVADGPTHWNEPQPEGVELSVLVDIQANPPLLAVQLAALERAQEMIAGQIAALRRTIG